MQSCEILIVGAGPTGLMLACALARQGLRPRIVDAAAQRTPYSKALAVQARTLEILEGLGAVAPFLERGRRIDHLEVRSGASRLVRMSLDELDSPYPFTLILEQSETERILEEELARHGLAVERGVELRSFVADAGGVLSRLADAHGERLQIESQWLIGCDGAHSTVRTLLGVAWDGYDIPGTFALADARLEGHVADDQGTVYFANDGVLSFIPLPREGWWRIVAQIDAPEDAPAPVLDAAQFEALAAKRAPDTALSVHELSWTSSFHLRQRKVTPYRRGRVLLAGDAAHSHSPVGGQGMNTGIGDAWNLAWKLALVIQGRGRAELVDSYELEREPVAHNLLQGTARSSRMVTLRSPLSRALRNQVARFIGGLDIVQHRMARALGETAIQYRTSPIVAEDSVPLGRAYLWRNDRDENATLGDWREFNAAPHAGDRTPDVFYGPADQKSRLHALMAAAPSHTLLLLDGHAATGGGYENLSRIASEVSRRYGDVVRTHIVVPTEVEPPGLSWRESILFDPEHELHERLGAGAECLYLIRPDGYFGYRSQPARLETLLAWLERIFV